MNDAESLDNFVKEVFLDLEKTGQMLREYYEDPPGRNPRSDVLSLSAWFRELSEEEKSRVVALMDDAARTSVFGLFCILDGVRKIGGGYEDGQFELSWISDETGERKLVSSATSDYFHDVFRSYY